jgi:hypothetical protein
MELKESELMGIDNLDSLLEIGQYWDYHEQLHSPRYKKAT